MIKLEHIYKTYKTNKKEIKALKNVNLEVQDGEMLAVFGPSGIGKTTLLNIIGGMDMPTSGRVIIDGVDISSLGADGLARFRKEKIGFVFQAFNLLPNLKARENIELPVLLDNGAQGKLERIYQFAAEIGLKERLEHRPMELSSGEQQRVAIMRAMVNSPSILLADEPTADLDEANAAKIIGILMKLRGGQSLTPRLRSPHFTRDVAGQEGQSPCTVVLATNDRLTASLFPRCFKL